MANFVVVAYAPFAQWRIDVALDEDFNKPMPQIVTDLNDTPKDCSDCELDLYIRPEFGSATLTRKIGTLVGGMFWVDRALGKSQVVIRQPAMPAIFQVGIYHCFWRLIEGTGPFPNITELCRGIFEVHAGNVDV